MDHQKYLMMRMQNEFYDNDIIFDVIIKEDENTATQVDAKEAVEDE